MIAAFSRRRLSPGDYLFLGAASGLVFGASEVERYIAGVVQNTGSGNITDGDAGILILAYVWRFITDPISHACWAGLTGYFIGLAVSGTQKWYRVFWVGPRPRRCPRRRGRSRGGRNKRVPSPHVGVIMTVWSRSPSFASAGPSSAG